MQHSSCAIIVLRARVLMQLCLQVYVEGSRSILMSRLICAGELPGSESPVICPWTGNEEQGGTRAEENWQHTAWQSGLQLLWASGPLYLCQVCLQSKKFEPMKPFVAAPTPKGKCSCSFLSSCLSFILWEILYYTCFKIKTVMALLQQLRHMVTTYNR